MAVPDGDFDDEDEAEEEDERDGAGSEEGDAGGGDCFCVVGPGLGDFCPWFCVPEAEAEAEARSATSRWRSGLPNDPNSFMISGGAHG